MKEAAETQAPESDRVEDAVEALPSGGMARGATFGRLDYDETTDSLHCHVCGQWKRNLAQHARRAHRLSAHEYRSLADLNRTTRLISPGMQARLRQVGVPLIERLRGEEKLKRWDEDREKFRRDKAAAIEVIRQGLSAEARSRRAAITPEHRQKHAEERRARNLAGLDRATPQAISEGLRRAAGEGACRRCHQPFQRAVPRHLYCAACRVDVERECGRESRRRARLREKYGDAAAPRRTPPPAKDTSREVKCPRCGDLFRAASHRDKYCPRCRPEAMRQYQREWKARKRTGQTKFD